MFLWVLGIWVLGTLIVLALLQLPRHKYEPTGDELVDRTALWILDHRDFYEDKTTVASFFRKYLLRRQKARFDVSGPLSWEKEFGNDLRYWQLLAQLDSIDKTFSYRRLEVNVKYESAGFGLSIDDLYELRNRHVFDEATYSLFSFKTGAFTRSGCTAVELEESIARSLQLVDEAIACNPFNSYFYYEKAHLLLDIGEWEEAWFNIKQGNLTPQNYRPLPFPQSALNMHGSRFTGDDNKLAAAALSNSTQRPTYRDKLARYKDLTAMIALGAPLELADDCLVCARRMAQMDGQDNLGQVTARVAAGDVLIDYVIENCIELNAGQRNEYKLIVAELGQSAAKKQAVAARHWPNLNNPADPYQFRLPFLKPADWDGEQKLQEAVEDCKDYFDILDPPPLATWGRGDLVGIE